MKTDMKVSFLICKPDNFKVKKGKGYQVIIVLLNCHLTILTMCTL